MEYRAWSAATMIRFMPAMTSEQQKAYSEVTIGSLLGREIGDASDRNAPQIEREQNELPTYKQAPPSRTQEQQQETDDLFADAPPKLGEWPTKEEVEREYQHVQDVIEKGRQMRMEQLEREANQETGGAFVTDEILSQEEIAHEVSKMKAKLRGELESESESESESDK